MWIGIYVLCKWSDIPSAPQIDDSFYFHRADLFSRLVSQKMSKKAKPAMLHDKPFTQAKFLRLSTTGI